MSEYNANRKIRNRGRVEIMKKGRRGGGAENSEIKKMCVCVCVGGGDEVERGGCC